MKPKTKAKHAEMLLPLIEQGLTIQQIADIIGAKRQYVGFLVKETGLDICRKEKGVRRACSLCGVQYRSHTGKRSLYCSEECLKKSQRRSNSETICKDDSEDVFPNDA